MTESSDDLPVPDLLIQPLFEKRDMKKKKNSKRAGTHVSGTHGVLTMYPP